MIKDLKRGNDQDRQDSGMIMITIFNLHWELLSADEFFKNSFEIFETFWIFFEVFELLKFPLNFLKLSNWKKIKMVFRWFKKII